MTNIEKGEKKQENSQTFYSSSLYVNTGNHQEYKDKLERLICKS